MWNNLLVQLHKMYDLTCFKAGVSNPAPGELRPADFSSNPAATHLSVIIK